MRLLVCISAAEVSYSYLGLAPREKYSPVKRVELEGILLQVIPGYLINMDISLDSKSLASTL